jgi:S-adenosylmethionine synthetase
LYGKSKRDGEIAVSSVAGAKVVILRVPVLSVLSARIPPQNMTDIRYGPAPKNSDSAVNILLDVVQDQSGKQYKMDHYATRYPTNVEDIAGFLVRVIGAPSNES